LHALVRVEACRVHVLVAQRVAEVLVLLHAGVAETGEAHRDADAVLDEELLGPELVVEPDARGHVAHRRGKVALPQVDGLAHVAVGVDDDRAAAVRAHGVPPRRLAHDTTGVDGPAIRLGATVFTETPDRIGPPAGRRRVPSVG